MYKQTSIDVPTNNNKKCEQVESFLSIRNSRCEYDSLVTPYVNDFSLSPVTL